MSRKQIYKNALISYGYISLLCLIKKNEEQENFKECKIILDVIKEHSKKYNVEIPTKFNEKSIDEYQTEFWRLGYSGDIAVENLPYYINEIESKLDKLK